MRGRRELKPAGTATANRPRRQASDGSDRVDYVAGGAPGDRRGARTAELLVETRAGGVRLTILAPEDRRQRPRDDSPRLSIPALAALIGAPEPGSPPGPPRE